MRCLGGSHAQSAIHCRIHVGRIDDRRRDHRNPGRERPHALPIPTAPYETNGRLDERRSHREDGARLFRRRGPLPGDRRELAATAPNSAVVQWDAASTAAFGTIGFRAEQAIRYRYDVDAGPGECGVCPTGGCFTVIGYSDLEGDGGIGAVGYYHPDAGLIECPASLFGWFAPLDPNTGNPIYNAAVPFPRIPGPLNPDDF